MTSTIKRLLFCLCICWMIEDVPEIRHSTHFPTKSSLQEKIVRSSKKYDPLHQKPSLQVPEQQKSVTIVTYSKDRPLQLYAFLESAYRFIKGSYKIIVIYATSHDSYQQGYQLVRKQFDQVEWVKQRSRAEFKRLTLDAVFKSPGDYLLFAVDDIIVKDEVNLGRCVELLERTKAHGFYLRLGDNITECYSCRKHTGKPPLFEIDPGVYAWRFRRGMGDWSQVCTADMTLYRKQDVKRPLEVLAYDLPNAFEADWERFADFSLAGLCFAESKIVNIPVNLVQSFAPGNRNMGLYTPQELLEKFLKKGLKIDIDPVGHIKNKAPHMAYEFQFIPR